MWVRRYRIMLRRPHRAYQPFPDDQQTWDAHGIRDVWGSLDLPAGTVAKLLEFDGYRETVIARKRGE